MVRPSPVIWPRVPKILVWRFSSGVNAARVNAVAEDPDVFADDQ
jgi:hypothetical protein